VIFYHHADYNICLGVHMEGAIHVDPHNVGFYNCRNKEGHRDNVYVPLTVDDQKVNRVGSRFMEDGELTTCSSGAYHKFRNFYLYPYIDRLKSRLKVRNGRHVHIGGISLSELASLRQALADEGIDPERFVHIVWTPSLWRTLVDQNVDLFIGSFPIGGARTTIEVMGAGIPILMPDNYLSRFFSSRDIVYPDAFVWKYPADFVTALETMTPGTLGIHAEWSRAHYNLQYCSATINLEARFNAVCASQPVPAAYALYPYHPDHLDKAMHFNRIAQLHAEGAAHHTVYHGIQHAIAAAAAGYAGERVRGSYLVRALTALREQARRAWAGSTRTPADGDLFHLAKSLSAEDRHLYHVFRQGQVGVAFDGKTYLSRNPDVAQSGADPLLHYVKYGRHEGREPAFIIR
jgi:hypothetical protein